ncbi:MAG: hypothetical protein AAGB46_04170 [Verrucomicrobiota bacterium]
MKLILTTLSLLTLAAAGQAIELVSASHRDADSFKRISEFFSGDENPGRYTLLRTDANSRDGFYLSLKLTKEERASIKSIRLHYVEPASLAEETLDLAINGAAKSRILVGLTGSLWQSADTFPLAWKVEALDANGQVLTHQQSFLWSPK